VPHVNEPESGSASRTARRFSNGSWNRPAGRELDDQRGRLAKGRTVSLSRDRVERRGGLVVADVHVDHRGPWASQETAAGHELVERDGQRGSTDFAGLAPVARP